MSELTDLLDIAQDANPPKSSLVRAVVRAAWDAVDPAPAIRWLAGLDPSAHDDDTRISAA